MTYDKGFMQPCPICKTFEDCWRIRRYGKCRKCLEKKTDSPLSPPYPEENDVNRIRAEAT